MFDCGVLQPRFRKEGAANNKILNGIAPVLYHP